MLRVCVALAIVAAASAPALAQSPVQLPAQANPWVSPRTTTELATGWQFRFGVIGEAPAAALRSIARRFAVTARNGVLRLNFTGEGVVAVVAAIEVAR